jgi:hypothetical protein
MAKLCGRALTHAPAIWVEKGNGTIGPVSAQTSSMSQLLRWKWKSVKPIATGILNSASSYALTRLSLGRPEESFQRAGHQHRERRSPSAYLCISSSGDEVIEGLIELPPRVLRWTDLGMGFQKMV